MFPIVIYVLFAMVLIVVIVIFGGTWNFISKKLRLRITDKCSNYKLLSRKYKNALGHYKEENYKEYEKMLQNSSVDELRHEQKLLRVDLGITWSVALSYTVTSVFLSKILSFFIMAWSNVEGISAQIIADIVEAIFVGCAIWIVYEARKKHMKESYWLSVLEDVITEKLEAEKYMKEKMNKEKKLVERLTELEEKVRILEEKQKEKELGRYVGKHRRKIQITIVN